MRILSIESSAKAASAAVLRDGQVEAYSFQNRGLTHSRTLLSMLEDMLKNSELEMGGMDYICAARGPGSFTGLRIGISAAKGLSLGSGIPCVGVSTLEAMSCIAPERDGIICCVMDARRGEVYNAIFLRDGEVGRITEDRAISLGGLAEELKTCGKEIICVGDAAKMCYNYLRERGIPAFLPAEDRTHQNAVGVALAAYKRIIGHGAAEDGDFSIAPVYLRLSQAEREKNEREKKI
ncbi:MAG: tRNA (adenosine(37)-N6)-threonylcarbamoyltransferase complex dimerization subunit type 1 TsaB [Oscillospiraceae bacterium]|nr:tRNA (adenosine(37)-N6)-threonylcarbamoyltransferase complex dimerization subunit type 1 TsaB [Oscillospiraceae bacterium]